MAHAARGLKIALACLLLVIVLSQACVAESNSQPGQGDPAGSITLRLSEDVDGFFVLNTTVTRTIRVGWRREVTVEVPVYVIATINGREATLTPPRGKAFSILGPFSEKAILVPYLATFAGRPEGSVTIDWPTRHGCRILIETAPSLEGVFPRLNVQVGDLEGDLLDENAPRMLTPNEQILLSTLIPELYHLSGTFVVPPREGLRLVITYDIGGVAETMVRNITARLDGRIVITDVAEAVTARNVERFNQMFQSILGRISLLEGSGYYLGALKQLLTQVRASVDGAMGSRLDLLASLRMGYTQLADAARKLDELEEGPPALYTASMLVAEFLACYLLAGLLAGGDAGRRRELLFLALFAVMAAAAFILIPGLKLNAESLLALVIAAAFILLLPRVLRVAGGVRTASGSSLEGLFTSMANFAVSFLAKRRLRAFLLLFIIAIVSVGVTCLTSFTAYSSINILSAPTLTSGRALLVVRTLTPAGPLNPAGLGVLSGEEGVEVAFSSIMLSPMNPMGNIGTVPVYCVIGVSKASPIAYLLEELVISGSAVNVSAGRGLALISDLAAERSGKGLGDKITVMNTEFTVAGIFDSRKLSSLKDFDGEDLVPVLQFGMSSYRAPPESVVFTSYPDSLLLGANLNKVYVTASGAPSGDMKSLAVALSALGNYVVYMVGPSGSEIIYPGAKIEISGREMLVPIIIASLLSFTAFIGFGYEMRRDIFTLSTLGATPTQTFLLFMSEAGLIGFLGGTLGYIAGMGFFRASGLLGGLFPVDVKIDLASVLVTLALATTTTIVGAIIPASKAVVLAVPSLARRWRMEAQVISRSEAVREVELTTTVPVIIRGDDEARAFVKFMAAKLNELYERKISVLNTRVEEDASRGVYSVYFEYIQVEKRAFKSYNNIMVLKTDSFYKVELRSKIVTLYTLFAAECLRDVASLVREIALQWSAKGGRVAVVLDRSSEALKSVLMELRPRYLSVITSGDVKEVKAAVTRMLRSLGYRAVIDVVGLGASRSEVEEVLKRVFEEVDTVCLISDDEWVSSKAFELAKMLGRRVLARSRSGELIEQG